MPYYQKGMKVWADKPSILSSVPINAKVFARFPWVGGTFAIASHRPWQGLAAQLTDFSERLLRLVAQRAQGQCLTDVAKAEKAWLMFREARSEYHRWDNFYALAQASGRAERSLLRMIGKLRPGPLARTLATVGRIIMKAKP